MQSIVIRNIRKKINYNTLNGIRNSFSSHIAFINVSYCIGCTKCITSCPADAIIGAKKQLHFIINQYCTGCNCCIDVCPTNCIGTRPTLKPLTFTQAKVRYSYHYQRINKKQSVEFLTKNKHNYSPKLTALEAIARAKLKKMQRQQLDK